MRCGSLALLCAWLPPQPTQAQAEPRVRIQATLGFADTFRLGYWTPLSVTVANQGPALFGELQVRLSYGREITDDLFTKTQRQRLEVSRGSRKRFRFTVFLESFAYPLEIRIESGGRVLASERVDLRKRFTESRLVLALTRDANLDYLNDSFGKTLRVLYPHPELLPDHWQGYDGVAAIIVHGVSLEALSRRQFTALEKWLARGGRLAVSGGPDYALLRTPRLAELLPATPTGLVAADVTAVGAAFSETLPSQAPFNLHRLVAYRGRIVYRAGDLPLVVERASGRGFVSYLSFDVASSPFDRWTPMRRVWLRLLRLAELPVTTVQREPRAVSVVPAALDRPVDRFPGHAIVVVLLVLYLGTLVTVYRLQPVTLRGRRLTPVLLLACPLLFAPAAWFVFSALLFPAGATAVVASVIQPFATGPYAQLHVDVGMFANRRQPLRLEVTAPEPGFLASQREARWGRTSSYSVQHIPGGVALQPSGSRAYVLHLLQGYDVIAYDVKASATRDERGIRMSVRNQTGQSWRDAWLVADHTLFRLGPMQHNEGAVLTRYVDTAFAALRDDAWRPAVRELTATGDRETRLTGALLSRVIDTHTATLNAGDALLAAIAPSPVRLGRNNAGWEQDALALVLIRLRIRQAEPGDAAR